MEFDPVAPIADLRYFQRVYVEYDVQNAWATELPETSSEAIDEMVSMFTAKGVNLVAMGAMLEKVNGMANSERKHIREMVEKRFAPDQIHLFIHSSQEERDELTQAWQKNAIERMKEVAAKIPKAAGTATKSVLMGGSIGCLVFIVAGVILGDASLSESGRVLLSMMADPPEGVDASGFTPVSTNQIVAAGATVSLAASAALIGAKASSNIIKELLKEDPGVATKNARRVLEDRVIGEFFRMKGEDFRTIRGTCTQDQVAKELKTVPLTYLPLLTHFKSRELISFLVADDDAREKMMSANPPEAEQRIDALRALHSGKLRRAWETTRQSLNAWEGSFSKDHGVTLKSSFGALLEARNRAKELPVEGQDLAFPAIR